MTAVPERPGPENQPAANDRFKKSFESHLWGSIILSTLSHLAVFGLWPDMVAEDISPIAPALKSIELPPKETELQESSGHERLDNAALAVADEYRFAPAMNRDRNVPVWIALPITFQVREQM